MKPDNLSERLLELAVRVGKMVDALPNTRLGKHIAGQLVRSGTSPAPNYEEACAAESRRDFIHKVRIALKELRETRCWIKLIMRSDLLPETRMAEIARETDELAGSSGNPWLPHGETKITPKQAFADRPRNEHRPILNLHCSICNLQSPPPAILMPTELKPIDRDEIEASLRLHVDRLAGLIGPRTLKKSKTIQATIGYIEGQWAEMGYTIDRESYDALGDEATNLIIEQPGSKRAREIVLLGAHYDTVFSTPGADDNASAVAVMLEVSRLLRNHTGRRTARYVAFACEEAPYFNLGAMGSQNHARQSRDRGDNIVGMLCLEMVGYYCLTKGSQAIPPVIPKFLHRFFPKRGNFLAAVGNMPSWKLNWQFRRGFKRGTRRLPLFSICLPEKISEIRLSDNSSFWDQGYPAIMLTDTSYLRNPNYHQATDTPDTLDYPRMTEVTLGVASAMRRLLG